nr:uncharacterized protein LOC115497019 [Taeniopygia guttata]
MAAPALYGHGTRWRRPCGRRRAMAAPTGAASRPSSCPPSAEPEERSWAGSSRGPGWFRLRAVPPLPASIGLCSRGTAALPLLSSQAWAASGPVKRCLFGISHFFFCPKKSGETRTLTNTAGCSGLSGAPQPPLLPRHKAAPFLRVFSSGRFLPGLPGARGASPGGSVGHRMVSVWMALGCSTGHCKGMDFSAFDYAVLLMNLRLGQFISLAWHTLLLWKERPPPAVTSQRAAGQEAA